MSCEEFWTLAAPEQAGHPHLSNCGACAFRARREQEMVAGLRAVAQGMRRMEAPPRVEARLLAAFRAQAVGPRARVRPRWIPVVSWAAAAAVVVASIGLIGPRPAQSRRTAEHVVAAAGLDSGVPDTAIQEGFLPLPGAMLMAPPEGVSVVHVELPRAAMMQVGIEVSPERAAETVQADVMFGDDGLARAVRFLDGSVSE